MAGAALIPLRGLPLLARLADKATDHERRLAGYASWRQSAADQAAFAVGSDVRVDSGAALPLGAAGAITRAPGVTAATSASPVGIGNGDQMIALDASTADKTIHRRPADQSADQEQE